MDNEATYGASAVTHGDSSASVSAGDIHPEEK